MCAERVVVTGIGVVSAAGIGVERSFEALRKGVGLAVDIPELRERGVAPGIGAVVDRQELRSVLSNQNDPRFDRTSQIGLLAASEAIAAARLGRPELVDASICVGTGSAGLAAYEEMVTRWESTRRLSPYSAPRAMVNNLAAAIANTHGVHGAADSFATACASGATAIGEATRRIRHGYAKRILAGGADAPIAPFNMSAFARMGALASARSKVSESSRPFNIDRDGFVMGEGAAFLMLESLASAEAREAPVIGEVLAYAATSDAHHIVAPHPEGKQAADCLKAALFEAAIDPGELAHLNAHGTATRLNDDVEAKVIANVIGASTPVVAYKGVTGHMLGASGAFEFAMDLVCTQRGVLPPIANLSPGKKAANLDFVTDERPTSQDAVFASNSFGFGGHNVVLVGRGSVDA